MRTGIALFVLGVILGAPQSPLGSEAHARRFQPTRPPARTVTVSGTDRDWPSYGGTLDNQRYSTLSQIDRDNVHELTVAWAFQVGYSTSQTSFECTPIVINGVMYVTSPKADVFALKADTGELLWKFDAQVDVSATTKLCCGIISRGVAAGDGKVYLATLDARLIALDQETGKPVLSFGDKGTVQIADYTQGYSETSPPIFYDGKLLIGVAGGEYKTRGFFSAYDAQTGKLLWRWYTVPSPDEPGGNTWPDTGIYKIGGGAAWMPPAVDVELGLVIFGTGNPNPDFDGSARAGDNLFTCAIVALDIATGKMRWYFQEVKHDIWDYDQPTPPLLFDVSREGRRVPAVGAAGKTGWFYILDRQSGKSLIPTEEKEVPQDPGQATARTQTFLTTPPFSAQNNLFTPPDAEGALITPGVSGGSEWSPISYSPRSGLAYVMVVEQATVLLTDKKPTAPDAMVLGGDFKIPSDPAATGSFAAIDVNTGLVRWRTPTVPYPVGGSIATAGDLVFAGESDGRFIALDALTGKRLWQFRCGAGVNAAPVTYAVNGQQYVAVAAGGNSLARVVSGQAGERNYQSGGTIFVFALPVRRSK
jgi:PQQ-dependent dehydrogenase (methanol/ethanol family)